MVSYASGTRFLALIGGVDPQLLRLVRRPAAGLAADLGRPDRRARVGRLVERRLPADLGDEPADDPHARRALHGRGAIPRPEGRRRLARLRRAHEVRRPVAPAQPGTDGALAMAMGARDPQGVPRRPHGAVLRGVRAPFHRPAVARDAARARRRIRRPADSCAPPTSARRARTPSGRRSCSTSGGRAGVPNGSVGFRWGEEGRASGTSSSDGIEPALTLLGPRASRSSVDVPRFDVGGTEGGDVAAPRRSRQAGRRPPRDDGLRPAAGPARRRREGLPGDVADAATTTPPSRTRPPGRSAITGVDAGARRGSPASSHGTRSGPKGAR